MANAADVLKNFYAAVVQRDLAKARTYLADDLLFVGLFETYHGPDQYLKALTGLLQVTVRLDVRKIIGEGSDTAVFFDLQTKAPVEANTFVAEWHQIKADKITRVQSAFDGCPSRRCLPGLSAPNQYSHRTKYV